MAKSPKRVANLITQSPQASWSAGGRQERLWGNGKNLIFLGQQVVARRDSGVMEKI